MRYEQWDLRLIASVDEADLRNGSVYRVDDDGSLTDSIYHCRQDSSLEGSTRESYTDGQNNTGEQ